MPIVPLSAAAALDRAQLVLSSATPARASTPAHRPLSASEPATSFKLAPQSAHQLDRAGTIISAPGAEPSFLPTASRQLLVPGCLAAVSGLPPRGSRL